MSTHSIVTLTTDWSIHDFFVGRVKGLLYSSIPGVNVVDVAHGIDPFDIIAASFVVKASCLEFPEGTVHIIDVASSAAPRNQYLLIRCRNQYFVMLDNGIPSLVFGDESWEAVVLSYNMPSGFGNFVAYDLYCPVVARLLNGEDMSQLGSPCAKFESASRLSHTLGMNDQGEISNIEAHVTYIDHYGNAYLDIAYEEFDRIRKNRPFELRFSAGGIMQLAETSIKKRSTISKISSSYAFDDSMGHKLLLTVSSVGCMQIAVNGGNASKLFGLHVQQLVTISFGSITGAQGALFEL
ncbi:MAG: SAM-dependent chlorinase/fluorinase [Bacteroidales bacterium]|nr:SAM-dependent chlorinase/fluorinase [Candidatus Colimorpha onthohippi]